MLLSYIKLSFRLLARNPFFTFINVTGLSIGFAVFFILWQYSQSELKSDQFHNGWEKIVKCGLFLHWTDDNVTWEDSKKGFNKPIIATQIAETYSEVVSMTRILPQAFFDKSSDGGYTKDHGRKIIFSIIDRKGKKTSFLEENVIYADTNLFHFFSIPLIKGNAQTVLREASSIVISRRKATLYFGDEDPVGKIMILNDSIPLMVTGIHEDVPRNTHLNFDIVLSMERIKETLNERRWPGPYCYLKLADHTNAFELEEKINKKLKGSILQATWGNWAYGKSEVFFEPLANVAFVHFGLDNHVPKSKRLLMVFSFSSWIILGMAWINYIIQVITFNVKRMKEQMVRKTVGAQLIDLIAQFLTESFLLHVISVLLALTIIQIIKTPLESLLHFYIPTWSTVSATSIIFMIFLFLLSVLITSLSPCITTLKTIQLNANTPFSFKGSKLNNNHFLATSQFAIAIVLIICTFCIYKQNQFILQRDIGMDRNQVLIVDLPNSLGANFESKLNVFTDEVLKFPSVTTSTVSFSVAGNDFTNYIHIKRPGANGGGLNVESDGGVDEKFVPFFDIKILFGRNFRPGSPIDKNTIILSEAAIKRLGFEKPEDALGQRIEADAARDVEIIGVMSDYQTKPFLNQVHEDNGYQGKPGLALTYKNFINSYANARNISFRIDSENIEEDVDFIKAKFHTFFPNDIFNYYFLDDKINSQYQNYKAAMRQISFFTLLAIGIALVGLLGMMSQKVIARTREMGIRKVLGARVRQIGYLLLQDTLRQVLVASIIGILFAIFLTKKYLEEFSERIPLQWWHFAFPVLILIIIMFVTIASVLWKAAKSNPAEALKYE